MNDKSGVYTLNPPRGRPANASEIVDYIIHSALRFEASDIHLAINYHNLVNEPYLIRFRINGKLKLVKSDFIGPYYREVVSRIKVLAGMSTTEVFVAQDGQLALNTQLGQIVLRISTIPSQDADDVCIRIQRSYDQKAFTLERLNMNPAMLETFKRIITQKSGMVILNGPAGSGKTTTIYTMLSTLASPEKKTVTAEDPIEMRLPYVNHTQITPKTDFAALCRAFMRQDADVIFVGEIRDPSSAAAAVQLAQTGHLLVTTLHTRDSLGVVSRLEALDVHPNFIATSIVASLGQRLVVKVCQHCKQEYRPTQKQLEEMHKITPIPKNAVFAKPGAGCNNCNAGVAGRTPIFELFVVDGEISELINKGATRLQLLDCAKSKGMKTFSDDALQRVYAGQVDLESIHHMIFMPSYNQ
jgi:type II secretory ATPase GspE/PulE/Tfp pilus assembly ATPase PilB-like protein